MLCVVVLVAENGRGQILDPRSMDHLFRSGPWTSYFSSLKKKIEKKKQKKHHISHRCCFSTVSAILFRAQAIFCLHR